MPTHINDGGTWRTVDEVHVNDGGTWRRINEIWVNDGGTWRQVFAGDQISIADTLAHSSASGVGNATATWRLNNTGSISLTQGTNTPIGGGNWITPQTNMSAFSAFATLLSGSLTSGTTGSWLNLGTTRTWTRQNNSSGSTTCVIQVQIRRDSDGTVMDTANITLEASNLD